MKEARAAQSAKEGRGGVVRRASRECAEPPGVSREASGPRQARRSGGSLAGADEDSYLLWPLSFDVTVDSQTAEGSLDLCRPQERNR